MLIDASTTLVRSLHQQRPNGRANATARHDTTPQMQFNCSCLAARLVRRDGLALSSWLGLVKAALARRVSFPIRPAVRLATSLFIDCHRAASPRRNAGVPGSLFASTAAAWSYRRAPSRARSHSLSSTCLPAGCGLAAACRPLLRSHAPLQRHNTGGTAQQPANRGTSRPVHVLSSRQTGRPRRRRLHTKRGPPWPGEGSDTGRSEVVTTRSEAPEEG
jgi:hypothetical protein